MNNRLFIFLFAIVVSIGLTWVNDLWEIKEQYDKIKSTEKIDYYLTDFSLLVTDKNGQKTYSLKGHHLAHWQQKNTSDIIQPEISMPNLRLGQQAIIKTNADKMIIHKNPTHFEFVDNVYIRTVGSKAKDAFSIKTEKLQFHLEKKQLSTDVAISIKTPNAVLTGIGMTGDLENKNLRIHSNVRATINSN